MATVPIVTEVTFAHLEALVAANGLNEGLQYKVTDKDWLLTATGSNTLKVSTGTITLLNEVLPAYIDADIVLVDTGYITTNLDISRFEIVRPTGYDPRLAYGKSNVDLSLLSIKDDMEEFDIFNKQAIAAGETFLCSIVPVYIDPNIFSSIKIYPGSLYVHCIGNTGTGFRIIIKYEKSLL